MTKQEFIQSYCQRSSIAPELILKTNIAIPCNCGDEMCDGWAMVSKDDPAIRLIHKIFFDDNNYGIHSESYKMRKISRLRGI
jgi:hypothetical protein